MKHNLEKLRLFLQNNRNSFNIYGITLELELPKNSLSDFVMGKYGLGKIYHEKVFEHFSKLGYKDNDNLS